jgi:hypothetical protein
MSEKIAMFISYRRDDTAGHVGRLYDALSARYGSQQIFVDIDHIGPGEDFVRALDDAVAKSLVTLVVIGKRWVMDESGYSRLQNPNDFVRLEVVAALQRGLKVIPVLVQGAQMPGARDLPWDLHDLTTRNAFELSDLRWKEDTARLTSELDRIIKTYFSSQPKPERAPRAPTPRWVWWAFAALLVVAAAGYVKNRATTAPGLSAGQTQTDPNPAPPAAPENVAYNAGSAKDDARRWRSDAQLVWVDIQQTNIPNAQGVRPFNILYQFVSPRDGRLMSVIDAPTGRTYAPVSSPIQTAIYPIVLPFMDLAEALKIASSRGLSGPIQRAYLYWRPLAGRPAVLVWTIYPYPQGPTPTQYNIDAQTGAIVPQPELIN